MDIKKIIAKGITLEVEGVNFESLINKVQDNLQGDYCIPCFTLSKVLRDSPINIANKIKDTYNKPSVVERLEVVNGYLNFFLNVGEFNRLVLADANNSKDFYRDDEFYGKKICVDYSSVNLAKYMHIGHLSTTIIGECIARMHESKGFNAVRMNYIGDYGTPFGKMIYGYLNWGSEKELKELGVDHLQDLYVKFCKLAEEDKSLEDSAREYFKLIEEKDETIYPIYQKFVNVSLIEAERLLNQLKIKFDTWKGESAYTSELSNVVSELEDKNLLIESEGAKIVNLEDYNLGVCLIQKSDGTSLYATRDIAAAKDRYNEYKFDKMYYVTAVQQKLHFEQFIKVLDLMGYDFAKNLKHIYYGMFSLPTGKIASRKGRQAVLVDLMEFALNKVNDIIKTREFKIEDKNEVAQKIAMGALKFTAIKTERVKDVVFDTENAFNFDGDTSAYMQYTYARLSSILRKANYNTSSENINYGYLQSKEAFNVLFAINSFKEVLNRAFEQDEPYVMVKYALDLCKLSNKFYASEKVITSNIEETNAKLYLINTIKNTLKEAFYLICLDTIEEM